ncbi:MAG: flavin reductase family protein [Lachnospiraceae bacterium]
MMKNFKKISWKPGNMIYPLPAVMVSVTDGKGHDNIITVAWTGTVNTNPPMAYISVRKERHSYQMLMDSREFVINLTTKELTKATDYCGVTSGRDVDKWEKLHLTKLPAKQVKAPLIAESPVNIECKVRSVQELGSHTMFLADVVNVNVEEAYLDSKGKFQLAQAKPIVYSHGSYFDLGQPLGTFGCSIAKKKKRKK